MIIYLKMKFVTLLVTNHCQMKQRPVSTLQALPKETKLEPRVAKFISLVCNVSMMKQQMMEIG